VKILRWLGHQIFPLLLIFWLNGLVLRVTVRDSVDLLAPLYYMTPWPVLAALTLPLVWRVRRQPPMVFGSIVITHVFLALWIMEDWRSGQPSRDPSDLRVVQWNVDRPVRRFPAIAQRLRAYDADLITVAEGLTRDDKGRERWREAFSDYKVEFTPGNMLCLVRGEVTARQSGLLTPASYYSYFDVVIGGRELRVLQVDISGVPTQPRREAMTKLTELANSLRDRPLIVLGDFNTPRDSVHFAELRKTFVNTFEAVGIGSGETWPMPLPVLSLDQIWCDRGLVPVRCHHEITFRSDHRPLIAELRFAPASKERVEQ
jgi:endonuclease/exonuclease/phosphatase (EEP) superfamily protein YafD